MGIYNSWHILGTIRKYQVKRSSKKDQKSSNPLLGLNQENRGIEEIRIDFKQKKSPFLMTFLFAPLFDERCNYQPLIMFVTIWKLKY
jgi:hypothetical protein